MHPFCHLHVHSEYSVLDGLARIPEYVSRAKSLGMPALALTDHGVLSGIPEFYFACRQEDINPVFGLEAYWVPLIDRSVKRPSYYHITFLAKGKIGYRLLTALSTESHRNYYYRPVLDRGALAQLGEEANNLYVLSGCAAGPLATLALNDDHEMLNEELSWWKNVFPNFYIELQDHGRDEDFKINNTLIKAAQFHNIPIVITNDPHYVREQDASNHDALLAIQTGSNINDSERFRFDGEGYWLKSYGELYHNFSKYPSWVWEQGSSNTLAIATACKVRMPEWERKYWKVPEVPDAKDPDYYLAIQVFKALKTRGLGKEYQKRAINELRIMKQLGVSGFVLAAKECVDFARRASILVGPGRGSVCGSLVCYLIGIHQIDPMKYGLRFDRFLNEERPQMPDIDIDLPASKRDQVMDYVKRRFGESNVLNICTYVQMKTKRALKALAKSHGISFALINQISKNIPDDSEEDDVDQVLPENIKKHSPNLIEQLRSLRGIKCGYGRHPAGVVIAPRSYHLSEVVPQMWLASSSKWVAQYDLAAFEHLGLLKQDLLGLRTLDTIQQCLDLIPESDRPSIDKWEPDQMPWDHEVYRMLANGHTAGVFQLEGASNAQGAKEIGIQSFNDLRDCLALYRKGPMLAGCTSRYLRNRRSGREEHLHPALKPILSSTYGALVYQEQIMEIGEKVAKLDSGTNYDLLKAVAKKNVALMSSLESQFVTGCMQSGLSRKQAQQLWSEIKENASYAFNLSHSTGYAMLAYWTATLKYLYPKFFFCALLRTVEDSDKRKQYLDEASKLGIKILRPCVMRSDIHAIPYRDNAVLLGLTDIKGIGIKAAQKIIQARPYETIEEVAKHAPNSRIFGLLKHSGALRRLGILPQTSRDVELLGWSFVDRMAAIRARLIKYHKPPHSVCGEIISSRVGKTKDGKPFCTWIIRWDRNEEWVIKLWSEVQSVFSTPVGSIVRVCGQYQPEWQSISCSSVGGVKILKVSQKSV